MKTNRSGLHGKIGVAAVIVFVVAVVFVTLSIGIPSAKKLGPWRDARESGKNSEPGPRISDTALSGEILPASTNAGEPTPETQDIFSTLYSEESALQSPQPDKPLAGIIKESGLKSPPPKVSIKIIKSEHILELYSGGKLLKTYPVALGHDEQGRSTARMGPKIKQGDRKTPEGKYYICNRNPRSSFHLFLGLSYPNIEDAKRGLTQGLIGKKTYDVIKTAINKVQKPPWETALGGAVGIHGGGIGSDWTFGCIAVENEWIEEIWSAARVGTPVEILP